MSRSSSSLKVRGAPRPSRGAPLSPAGGCNSRDAHCASYANRKTTALSVHVSSWAWGNTDVAAGDLLVLLALADMANDDAKAWPSQESLAKRSRLTDRQVRRCLKSLTEKNLIRPIGKTRAGTVIHEVIGYLSWRADNMSGVTAKGGHSCPDDPDVDVLRSVSEPSIENPPNPLRGDVQQVYEHWRTSRKRTRVAYATCSSARRRKIEQRLREFTVAELVAAIDAVALDDWKDRPKHDDLTVIFRSREQVERFLELADTTPGGGKRVPAIDRAVEFVKRVGGEYPTSQSLLDELEVLFPSLSEHERRRVAAMRSAA